MPVQASFYAHAVTPDGKIILVGQGSVMATSVDGGHHFTLSRAKGRTSLTDLLLLPDGQGWLASDAGLQAFSPATATAPAAMPTPAPQASATPSSGAAQ